MNETLLSLASELSAKVQAFDELKKTSQDIAELRDFFETDALLSLLNKNQKRTEEVGIKF